MSRILIFLAMGLAYYVWQKHEAYQFRQAAVAAERSLATGEHNCSKTEKCVVVYVAPWCPACKKLKPQFQRALKKGVAGGYGFRMIVGRGSDEQNRAEAAELGLGTFVDADSALQKSYRVHSYPNFLILDKDQKVIARDQAAIDSMLENFFPEAPKLPAAVKAQMPPGAIYLPI